MFKTLAILSGALLLSLPASGDQWTGKLSRAFGKPTGRSGTIAPAAFFAFEQEHKWAGRTLEDLEWRIHEELAMLPFYGVFDTVRFELQGTTVTLTGQVLRETVKMNAERVVKRLDGIESVVNHIEVLPSSRRDDAIRMNVYRAIYESRELESYGTHAFPPIHIIVKDAMVTLEGVVTSESDRNTASLRALKATHHITNNLRVAPVD